MITPILSLSASEALDTWFDAQLRTIDAAAVRWVAKDAEALHDLRVGLRRLHSGLRAYNAWLGLKPGRLRRVRLLARASNAARDGEVQREWLLTQTDLLPRERCGQRWLLQHIAAAEADPAPTVMRRWQKLALTLRRRWSERLAGLAAEGLFAPLAAQVLRAQATILLERLQAEQASPSATGLHAARIEAKRLRYLLEPIRPGLPEANALLQMLKDFQAQIGELHDLQVLATVIEQAVTQAGQEQAQRCYQQALLGAAAEGVQRLRRRDPLPGLCALGVRVQTLYQARWATVVNEYLAPAWLATLAQSSQALGDAVAAAATTAASSR